MRLAEQLSEIEASLPRAWETAELELEVAGGAEDAERAARVLGPAAAAGDGGSLRVEVVRRERAVGTTAVLLRRALERLDREGVAGELRLADATAGPAGADGPRAGGSLANELRAVVAALPADWSHLLVDLELRSSDFVDRAALLLAPANPTLADGRATLRFRIANRVGYGVSTRMAARCLERLDEERITGRIVPVHVVSEARPMATQGPVWRLGGRSV